MKVIVTTEEEIRSIIRRELVECLAPAASQPRKKYTTEEAAEYLGLSLATFRQHQHRIGGVRIGKRWQFTQLELDRYIETNRRQTTQEVREKI